MRLPPLLQLYRLNRFIFMVLRLMPHRKALFKQLFAPLGIHTHANRICGRDGVISKDAGHTAQQAGCSEKDRGAFAGIPIEMIQEKLRIFIALRGGTFQILPGDFEILSNLFALQIQFAERIFRKLISLPGAGLQVFERFVNVFWHVLAHQVHLAQGVLRELIALSGAGVQIFQRCRDILRHFLSGKV